MVASNALTKWTASHRDQVAGYLAGDYPAAVRQAIGPEPNGSAAHFATIETSLTDAVEQTRTRLRDEVSAAGTRLAWSP